MALGRGQKANIFFNTRFVKNPLVLIQYALQFSPTFADQFPLGHEKKKRNQATLNVKVCDANLTGA